MKRMIALVLALVLALGLTTAMAEEGGFGLPAGVEWGDSLEKVAAVVGDGFDRADNGAMSSLSSGWEKVNGVDCHILYLFLGGELVGLGYSFDPSAVTVDDVAGLTGALCESPIDFELERFNELLSTLEEGLTLGEEDAVGFRAFRAEDGAYAVAMQDESIPALLVFAEDRIDAFRRAGGAAQAVEAEPAGDAPTESAPAEGRVFRLTFSFDDDSEQAHGVSDARADLDRINAALSGLELTGVSIEDDETYITVSTSYGDGGQVESVEYAYGFKALTLVCEQKQGENAYHFQIDTVIDPEGAYEPEAFHDYWSEQHPDRVMRRLTQHSGLHNEFIENGNVFIVIHAERNTQE